VEPIDPDLRIRSVSLAVSDLGRSTDFYERVLGLPVLARTDSESTLGGDAGNPALRLVQLADPRPVPVHSTGLFHVAWLHRSRAGLAETVRRVLAGGRRFDGASDHGVSEALYLSDPDGLGIELYADRPREQWERPPSGQGVRMFTLPLDIEDLLAQFEDEPGAAIEPGTDIGHVHMKVSDVPRAAAFYGDRLGFEEQARIPSAAFLSAGGYHHHVGLNSWQSQGAEAADEHAPGLRLIEFELGDERALGALERRTQTERAEPDGGAPVLTLRDPDSQLISFGLRDAA
jgi:catechol 2,3-dioxygenase